MSDNVARLREFIDGKRREEQTILKHLDVFRDNLYSAFEEAIAALRQNGIEDEISEAKRERDGKQLTFTVNEMELVYVPLTGVAYDTNAPFEEKFEQAPTGRLLVFPNELGAIPIYSYWINNRGEWTGAGVGHSRMGQVADHDGLRAHAFGFLSDMFTEVRKHWNPLNRVILGDVIESNQPPLGFRTPNLEQEIKPRA